MTSNDINKQAIGILLLGGGKRVTMARMLKDAARRLGYAGANIYSYEAIERVPIACEGTVIIGKRWSDPDVYDDIDELVRAHDIRVIIPFVDGAVGVSAEYARRYPGRAFVPTGEREIAEAMFDKVKAAEIFAAAGLPIPRTYHAGDPCMRLIAKPRHGSASKGIIAISSLEALNAINAEDYLIQDRIDNREEYTLDCYASVTTGEILAAVARRRLEVVGGEVSRTITISDPEIEDLARRTITVLGLRGAITVQMMRDLDTSRLMLMEINPRLGGGAVCSVHAGADIPLMILTEACGGRPAQAVWRAGVEIARYMHEVVWDDVSSAPRPLLI